MTEQWRPVVGWEDRYEVSEFGRIRSRDMLVGARGGGTALRRGRTLVQIPKQGRYLAVTMTARDGTRAQMMVHDIVAAAFVGPKPAGLLTLHFDDDKANNAASNLRYGTHLDNSADKRRNGNATFGERHPQATVKEQTVRDIRAAEGTGQQIADRFGVSKAVVYQIRSGRTWKHLL